MPAILRGTILSPLDSAMRSSVVGTSSPHRFDLKVLLKVLRVRVLEFDLPGGITAGYLKAVAIANFVENLFAIPDSSSTTAMAGMDNNQNSNLLKDDCLKNNGVSQVADNSSTSLDQGADKEEKVGLRDSTDQKDQKNSIDQFSSDADESPTDDLSHEFDINLNGNNDAGDDNHCTEAGGADHITERKRKKKKKKGSTRNPKQIFAYNECEKSKIESSKATVEAKKGATEKTLDKSASFPSSDNSHSSKSIPINVQKNRGCSSEDSTGSEWGSLDGRDVLYSRALSFPPSFKLVPAIRGGRERKGMEPKPKLSVSWAPDVQEPPISSVSHTVRALPYRRTKRKEQKNSKKKGKSGRGRGKHKTKNAYLHSSSSETELFSPRSFSVLQDHDKSNRSSSLNSQMDESDNMDDILLDLSENSLAAQGKKHLENFPNHFTAKNADLIGYKDSDHTSFFWQSFQNKQIPLAEST